MAGRVTHNLSVNFHPSLVLLNSGTSVIKFLVMRAIVNYAKKVEELIFTNIDIMLM